METDIKNIVTAAIVSANLLGIAYLCGLFRRTPQEGEDHE